jgi:hypothetical protein
MQIDCNSSVSKVATWSSELAALAAGGIGDATLAAIVFWGIQLAAIAAESAPLV